MRSCVIRPGDWKTLHGWPRLPTATSQSQRYAQRYNAIVWKSIRTYVGVHTFYMHLFRYECSIKREIFFFFFFITKTNNAWRIAYDIKRSYSLCFFLKILFNNAKVISVCYANWNRFNTHCTCVYWFTSYTKRFKRLGFNRRILNSREYYSKYR